MSAPMRYYSFETTPLWLCPLCGRVETCGETWTPHPICNCRGPHEMGIKQLNKPAQQLMKNIEAWHREREKQLGVAHA